MLYEKCFFLFQEGYTWFPSLMNVFFYMLPLSSHFEIEIAGLGVVHNKRDSSQNLNVCVGTTKMDKYQKLNVYVIKTKRENVENFNICSL